MIKQLCKTRSLFYAQLALCFLFLLPRGIAENNTNFICEYLPVTSYLLDSFLLVRPMNATNATFRNSICVVFWQGMICIL